jgi:hypothetical protein
VTLRFRSVVPVTSLDRTTPITVGCGAIRDVLLARRGAVPARERLCGVPGLDPATEPIRVPPSQQPGTATRRAFGATVTATAALVVLASFLPWLSSGAVDRSSYRAIHGIARLRPLEAWPDLVATAWPVLVAASVLPVLLVVLGRVAAAAVAAIALGVAHLGTAVTVLALAGRSVFGVRVALSGPVLLAVTAMIMVVAGIVALRRR